MEQAEYIREQLKQLFRLHMRDPINPDGKTIAGVKGDDRESYFEYNYTTAKAFLTAIDIQSELYRSGYSAQQRTFYFRGHAKSDWFLRPSVYRYPNDDLRSDDHARFLFSCPSGNGVHGELNPFLKFLEEVNKLGFLLEEDVFQLLQGFREQADFYNTAIITAARFNRDLSIFPSASQERVLALAQHYGVPTRLLDFTKNPYKAAFFAISGAKFDEDKATEDTIGLWVIPKLLLVAAGLIARLKIVEAPAFQNANIAAQEGVFVNYFPPRAFSEEFPMDPNAGDDHPEVMSLDQFLHALGNKEPSYERLWREVIGKPLLFTLPYQELYLVIRKLNQLHISWTTLMPGLEGAAKQAIEELRFPIFSS